VRDVGEVGVKTSVTRVGARKRRRGGEGQQIVFFVLGSVGVEGGHGLKGKEVGENRKAKRNPEKRRPQARSKPKKQRGEEHARGFMETGENDEGDYGKEDVRGLQSSEIT